MKRLLHTPLALLLRRIVLLYAVLMLCRVVFYLYNAQLLGTIGRGELWQLLAGSLKFDTVWRCCPCMCANAAGTAN